MRHSRAAGRSSSSRSVQPLADCLDDPHYWVAHNAAMALAEIGGAGVTALSLAAAGLGSGAAHAREALARRALARGERPAAPVRTDTPVQGGGSPVHTIAPAPASARGQAPAPAQNPAPAQLSASAEATAAGAPAGHQGPGARGSRQGR